MSCGAVTSFGNSKPSALIPKFKVGEVWYGLSAQHPRLNYSQGLGSPTSAVDFLAFGEDSDEEVNDIATATSKGELFCACQLLACD